MSLLSDAKATVAKFLINMGRFDQIMNGDKNTDVSIDVGTIPTLRKLFDYIVANVVGVKILGSVNNVSDLPTTGNKIGDIYIVLLSSANNNAGDGYVWTGSQPWRNIGPIRGPKGDIGPVGPPGSYIGAGIIYMPEGSGDAATDTARFNTEKAKGIKYIEFKDSTYLVTAAGIDLNSKQELIGHGSGLTIWKSAAQAAPGTEGMFRALEKSDVTIRGITFDYNNYREPSAGWAMLNFRNIIRGRLYDVNLINWPRFGLSINGGNDFIYDIGAQIRANNPLDVNGVAIPKGVQNQSIVISQSANPFSVGRFTNLYSKGSAVDVSGSGILFYNMEVDTFDFGFAYVTEQDSRCHHITFLNCIGKNGRSASSGYDVNNTSAGGFEIWSPFTIIDHCRGENLGGDGVSLGGKYSTVNDNVFTQVGMQVPAVGIMARWELDGAYSADGSEIHNNKVYFSDGSQIVRAYDRQDLTDRMNVSLGGNNFGLKADVRKGLGEKWQSPGLLLQGKNVQYSNPVGQIIAAISISVPGAIRGSDNIVGVTFKADDNTPLPTGLQAFAEIIEDNTVVFYTRNFTGNSALTVKAGTFSGRLVAVS